LSAFSIDRGEKLTLGNGPRRTRHGSQKSRINRSSLLLEGDKGTFPHAENKGGEEIVDQTKKACWGEREISLDFSARKTLLL